LRKKRLINEGDLYYYLFRIPEFRLTLSQRVNEHVGLCTQWKLCCLKTLMQLDATINDVTTTTNQIYTYKASSCFSLAVRSRHVPRAIINSLCEELYSHLLSSYPYLINLWISVVLFGAYPLKTVKLCPRGKMRKQNGYQSCIPVRVFVINCDVSRNVTRDNHAIDVT